MKELFALFSLATIYACSPKTDAGSSLSEDKTLSAKTDTHCSEKTLKEYQDSVNQATEDMKNELQKHRNKHLGTHSVAEKISNAATAGRIAWFTPLFGEPRSSLEYEIYYVKDGQPVRPRFPLSDEDKKSYLAIKDKLDSAESNLKSYKVYCPKYNQPTGPAVTDLVNASKTTPTTK